MDTSALTCRSRPCPGCPYRKDVPSGVWASEEYAKLRRYDASTGDQPPQPFMCHATPERLCHGWTVVHSGRGHAFELLALRLLEVIAGNTVEVPAPAVPLFASGTEAADHGERDVDAPGPEAHIAIDRLRRYPRLRDEVRSDPATPERSTDR